MTAEEKKKVLESVKAVGRWQTVAPRPGFAPVPWETQIGDLDAFRQHEGQSRKILPPMTNQAKADSVVNSIKNRLSKLYPKESWTALVRPDGIHLRYNGAKRTIERTARSSRGVTGAPGEEDDLFAAG